jgi:hypothetical protein
VKRAIKQVLSVARTPSKAESVQVHWRSPRMKHTTLSIPWPSARNERGSCPSTYPAPWANHVLSSKERAHPYVPSWVMSEPLLQAWKGEHSNLEMRIKGSKERWISNSSWDSQSSRSEQKASNDVGFTKGSAGQYELYLSISQPFCWL